MPQVGQNVTFLAGLHENYVSIEEKNLNTVYFCTDTQQLFVGETEYTRPVQYGSGLPSGYLPPNSLFYHTGEKALYFSQDGTSWQTVSNFYTHPSFTARTLGQQTGATLAYGGTFKVPSITVDGQGHVTAGADQTFTLPAAQDIPEVPDVTAQVTGSGNVITNITASKHAVTATKGFTAASQTDLAAVEATANAAMPKSGGTFTGAVSVPTPSANAHAATKAYVDQAEADAVQSAKAYADGLLGANDAMVFKGTVGTGGTVTQLPTTHSVGWTYRVITAGFYAGQNCEVGDLIICITDGTSANNAHWTVAQTNVDGAVTHDAALTADQIVVGDGNGSVKSSGTAISSLATTAQLNTKVDKTTTVNGHALSDDVTITKGDVGLGNVDNTADASKSVASAAKLTTARTITVAGDATGSVSFDGTKNVTLTVDVARATADASGNNIASTYATKTEVQNASLKWGEF